MRHSGTGSTTISDNEISGNSSSGTSASGGGIACFKSTAGMANIFGNIVVGNSAVGTTALGIGIFASASSGSTVVVRSNTVTNNVPTTSSGKPLGSAGIATTTSVGGVAIVQGNTVLGNRGGISASSAGTTEVSGNIVTGNLLTGISASATAGEATVDVNDNTVTGNLSTGISASASAAGATLDVNDNAVIGSSSTGISASATATGATVDVNDNIVFDNLSTGIGLGGLRGTVRSARNVVTGNHAQFAGGGFILNAQNGGSVSVLNSTIAGNTSESLGGGFYTFLRTGGSIEIIGSTISDNRAIQTSNPDSGYAGGISVRNDGGLLVIDQSTISTNSADTDGGGIWVDNVTDGGAVIKRSTITKNISDANSDGIGTGGGVFVSRGTVDLDQTIVAGNHDNTGVAPDVAGVFNASRSLIGVGASFLGPLADNGGPTMTHALLPGSPAINAGDPAATAGVNGVPLNDQRSAPFTRVYGGRIDIGEFEVQPTDYVLGDFNRDGAVDAADYMLYRKQMNQTVPPGTGADANGDWVVDNADYLIWKSNYGQPQIQLPRPVASEPVSGLKERMVASLPDQPAVLAPTRTVDRSGLSIASPQVVPPSSANYLTLRLDTHAGRSAHRLFALSQSENARRFDLAIEDWRTPKSGADERRHLNSAPTQFSSIDWSGYRPDARLSLEPSIDIAFAKI